MQGARPTSATSGGSGGSRAQVLLVDDEKDLQDVLRLVLEEEGYSVTTASSGPGALAILRASVEPYVVLLDHYLPGMNGLAVVRALYADPSTRGHAVIYMSTGSSGEMAATQAQLAEMGVQYVSKPFDIEDVLRVVAAAAARLPRLDMHVGWRGPPRFTAGAQSLLRRGVVMARGRTPGRGHRK